MQSHTSTLKQDQVEFFHKNGYLVIENFWDVLTVNRLRSRIDEIIQSYGDLTNNKEVSVFTTKEQQRNDDDYFLKSGENISYFWEEHSRDSSGHFLHPPNECINKIGHALHDLDPVFQSVSYTPRIEGICRDLGLSRPLPVQSMYIFKQPHIGGEVGAHQDGTFLYTEPQSVIGFWWPLHDCDLTNGCLWAVPGSHVLPVTRKFRRKASPQTGTEFFPKEAPSFDVTGAVPLLIPAGSLVLLHSALVHYSERNTSSAPRHAYSIHIVDGADGVLYPADNWLQRPQHMPFRFLEFLSHSKS